MYFYVQWFCPTVHSLQSQLLNKKQISQNNNNNNDWLKYSTKILPMINGNKAIYQQEMQNLDLTLWLPSAGIRI